MPRRAHGGARQDAPGKQHRPFAGVEATWSPTFGKQRQARRVLRKGSGAAQSTPPQNAPTFLSL